MIGEVKNEIDNAIIKLKLSQKDIFLLDNHAGKKVFNECISHFLNSGDRRWWWEDFKFPSFSLIDLVNSFTYIDQIIPLKEGNVWLIIEDNYDSFFAMVGHFGQPNN